MRHKGLSPKTIAILTALRCGGKPPDVARAFGVSFAYVYSLRKVFHTDAGKVV